MTEHEMPFCPQGPGDAPQSRFSAIPRTFHKGSKSSSSQSHTTKDNSSVGEDEFLNATDGATAARDSASAVSFGGGGKGTRIADLSTQNIHHDNSGAMDIGDGNTVTIESLDGQLASDTLAGAASLARDSVSAAIEANEASTAEALSFAGQSAEDAFAFGETTIGRSLEFGESAIDAVRESAESAISGNSDLAGLSIEANSDLAGRVVDEAAGLNQTLADALETSLAHAERAQEAANLQTQLSTNQAIDALAEKVADAPQVTQPEDISRNLKTLATGGAVLAGLMILAARTAKTI